MPRVELFRSTPELDEDALRHILGGDGIAALGQARAVDDVPEPVQALEQSGLVAIHEALVEQGFLVSSLPVVTPGLDVHPG